MSKDADIAAAGNGHASFKRLFENKLLPLSVCTCDRQRGTQSGAVFSHQPKQFRRAAVAMLDRFDAGENCPSRAFSTRSMRRDGDTRTFRDLNRQFQFV